jgi:hypothetical protein
MLVATVHPRGGFLTEPRIIMIIKREREFKRSVNTPRKKKKKIEPPKRRGARKKDKLVKNGGWEAGTEHTRDIDTFTYQKSLQPNTCRADNCPFPETPVRTHAHTHTCASSK